MLSFMRLFHILELLLCIFQPVMAGKQWIQLFQQICWNTNRVDLFECYLCYEHLVMCVEKLSSFSRAHLPDTNSRMAFVAPFCPVHYMHPQVQSLSFTIFRGQSSQFPTEQIIHCLQRDLVTIRRPLHVPAFKYLKCCSRSIKLIFYPDFVYSATFNRRPGCSKSTPCETRQYAR